MKSTLLLFSLTALLLASCSKKDGANTAGDNALQPAVSATAKQLRPLTGSITYAASAGQDMGCDCGTFAPAGNFYGTGNLSLLGASSSMIAPCIAPLISNGIQVGFHVGHECATFTAANGDMLYMETHPYDLLFSNGAFTGNVFADIAGGTGRFVNATGSFTGIITTDGQTSATLSNINGSISY